MTEQQMCLGCNTQPAVTDGPIPLCAECEALAKKNERGVKFDSTPPDTLRTGETPPSK